MLAYIYYTFDYVELILVIAGKDIICVYWFDDLNMDYFNYQFSEEKNNKSEKLLTSKNPN